MEFTSSSDDGSLVPPKPFDQIFWREETGTTTDDGTYDMLSCHTEIIPIRQNGHPSKEHCPAAIARNETLRGIRHYRRAFLKRLLGNHVRSPIKTKMRCLKAFGERIPATHFDSHTAETQIRAAPMDSLSVLGTSLIIRTG